MVQGRWFSAYCKILQEINFQNFHQCAILQIYFVKVQKINFVV